MIELPIKWKLYAHSKDGKKVNESYRTQKGFEEENRKTLERIFSLKEDELFSLIADASVGETDVDGKDPFLYSRETDTQDNRLGKAITYALDDLRNPDSSLRKGLYIHFRDKNKDEKENLIDFGMKVIDAILADGGAGSGGHDISGLEKIVAKVYESYANRYLDYGEYLNYFSFYLEPGMFEEELKSKDPINGDFMLDKGMKDLDEEFVLSHIVPALYYSFNFLNKVGPRVRSIYDYSLELG